MNIISWNGGEILWLDCLELVYKDETLELSRIGAYMLIIIHGSPALWLSYELEYKHEADDLITILHENALQ